MDRNKWIEKVLSSAKVMQRAEPPTYLYAKIKDRIATDALYSIISLRRAIAAAVVVLVLNAGVLLTMIGHDKDHKFLVDGNRSENHIGLISDYNIYRE